MTLEQARDLIGWTQTRLAAEAGLHVSIVNDIERGKNRRPSHVTVTNLIRALRRGGLPGIAAEDVFPVPDATAHSEERAI